MSRWLVLIALAGSAGFGQISGLVTTDDGGQVYFSTPLRLRGSQETFYPKILRYVGRFELFREVELQTPAVNPAGIYTVTNFFELTDPQVSGDGTVVTFTANAICSGGSPDACVEVVGTTGNIVGAGIPSKLLNPTNPLSPLYNGEIRLSADRRYVLMMGELAAINDSFRVIDLVSGAITPLPNCCSTVGDARQVFADDGSLLLVLLSDQLPGPLVPLVLWTPASGAAVTLRVSQVPLLARLSRNRAKVIYEAATSDSRSLIAFDVASQSETVLATAPGTTILPNDNQYEPYFYPWVTRDGSTVLFLSADSNGVTQAFLIGSDGSGLRQITSVPEGVSDATVSGYGNVVYAATPKARLMRIEVQSNTVTELAPPSAQADSISTPAPGSLAQFSGHGLIALRAVSVNGEAAPVYTKTDTTAVFQIPWDTSVADPATMLIADDSNSPFEGALVVPLTAVNPSFLPFNTGFDQIPMALHQDGKTPVTEEDPAKAGEVITLYLTGMGPVNGSVETGAPAPASGPLETVVNTFTCTVAASTTNNGGYSFDAPVVSAGLAPGLIGVYQMKLRVPQLVSNVRPDSIILTCDAPPSIVPANGEAYAHLPIAAP
jgi:uncharacterized protein (TIGR03437 family)